MKKLLWAPGYIIIAIVYFFPTEWGKKRNVALGSRWWNYKDYLAPIFSICLYIYIAIKMVFPSTEVKPASEPIQSERPEKNSLSSTTELAPNNVGLTLPEQARKGSTSQETKEVVPSNISAEVQNAASQVMESTLEKPEEQQAKVFDKNPDIPSEERIQYIPGH